MAMSKNDHLWRLVEVTVTKTDKFVQYKFDRPPIFLSLRPLDGKVYIILNPEQDDVPSEKNADIVLNGGDCFFGLVSEIYPYYLSSIIVSGGTDDFYLRVS